MRPPLRVGAVYDFRNTPESGMDMPSLYAAIMEQVVMLDGLGLDLVWFSEHHFVEDGYLPNFVPVAGAAAAVTTRIRISTDIALAPFAHPLRLAEDMAILDQLSAGRMELGLGHPRGPIAWGEAIGLEHVMGVLDGLWTERREERYRPAPLLVRRSATSGIARG